MNRTFGNCFCATICSLLAISIAGSWPEKTASPKVDEAKRLGQVELRLESLEQILFATSQLDAREATRRLERARQQLEGTRDLFQRGLIADWQLAQDRFAVLIAERELELAANPTRHRHLVSSLELLDAQRRVEMAQLNLRQTTNMNNRGFSSLSQIDDAKRELSTAESAVATAQAKVDAAAKLDAIDKTTGPPREEDPKSDKTIDPSKDK